VVCLNHIDCHEFNNLSYAIIISMNTRDFTFSASILQNTLKFLMSKPYELRDRTITVNTKGLPNRTNPQNTGRLWGRVRVEPEVDNTVGRDTTNNRPAYGRSLRPPTPSKEYFSDYHVFSTETTRAIHNINS
jgi:hypothetical protein